MKLLYFYIILFFFFIGFSKGYSQEYKLTFRILNENTGQAIENVNIYIQPCTCGGVSNNEGLFSLKLLEDKYQIIISYTGFKEEILNVDLNKDMFFEVALKVTVEKLSEVIIKAKKL